MRTRKQRTAGRRSQHGSAPPPLPCSLRTHSASTLRDRGLLPSILPPALALPRCDRNQWCSRGTIWLRFSPVAHRRRRASPVALPDCSFPLPLRGADCFDASWLSRRHCSPRRRLFCCPLHCMRATLPNTLHCLLSFDRSHTHRLRFQTLARLRQLLIATCTS